MVGHLSSEVRQHQIEWRRDQVLELSREGYNQREIAHVQWWGSNPTAVKDIKSSCQ
jgi:hypothetical protein